MRNILICISICANHPIVLIILNTNIHLQKKSGNFEIFRNISILAILVIYLNIDRLLTHLALEMLTHLKTTQTQPNHTKHILNPYKLIQTYTNPNQPIPTHTNPYQPKPSQSNPSQTTIYHSVP